MFNCVLTQKGTHTHTAPCWATAEGVGLKDDTIPSLISANVFVFPDRVEEKWEKWQDERGNEVDKEKKMHLDKER